MLEQQKLVQYPLPTFNFMAESVLLNDCGNDVMADMCRKRANFRLRIGLTSIFSGLCFETALFISDDDVDMSSSP